MGWRWCHLTSEKDNQNGKSPGLIKFSFIVVWETFHEFLVYITFNMKVTHLQEMDFFCFLGMNFLRQTNLPAFIQDTVLYTVLFIFTFSTFQGYKICYRKNVGWVFKKWKMTKLPVRRRGYSIIYSFVYLSSVYFLSAPGGIPCSNLMIDENVAFIKLVL